MIDAQTQVAPAAHAPTLDAGQVATPLADLRAVPDAAGELLNQALLGTPLTVDGAAQGAGGLPWLRVCLPDYAGWMRASEVIRPAPPAAADREICVAAVSTELRVPGSAGHGAAETITVYMGTRLPATPDASAAVTGAGVPVRLPDGRLAGVDPAALAPRAPGYRGDTAAVIAAARAFLGTRYLWGGMTRQGIDCSGLVQIAYRVHGYPLPRDADEQFATLAHQVAPADRRPGDLLFFGAAPDKVTHVTLYLGDALMIHASSAAGGVVVQSLDPRHAQYHARSDVYLGARRVIPAAPHEE